MDFLVSSVYIDICLRSSTIFNRETDGNFLT